MVGTAVGGAGGGLVGTAVAVLVGAVVLAADGLGGTAVMDGVTEAVGGTAVGFRRSTDGDWQAASSPTSTQIKNQKQVSRIGNNCLNWWHGRQTNHK
jgi:hypothetical protein